MRMVVDLPAPLLPRKPKISPRATSKLTSSTAMNSPNRRVRWRTTIAWRVDPPRPRRQRPRRALQPRLGQSTLAMRARAIELGLQQRHLRVEHVGGRRHAGAVTLADDALGLGAARTSSSAAATAARLESSSQRRWRTSKVTWRSKSPTRALSARAVAAASRLLGPARPPSHSDQVTVDARRPRTSSSRRCAERSAGSAARSRSRAPSASCGRRRLRETPSRASARRRRALLERAPLRPRASRACAISSATAPWPRVRRRVAGSVRLDAVGRPGLDAGQARRSASAIPRAFAASIDSTC